MKRWGTRRERATLKGKKLRQRSVRKPTPGDAPLQPKVLTLREKLRHLEARLVLLLIAVTFIYIFNQLRAPHVQFVGRVIDTAGSPVAGAGVPWQVEKEGGFDTDGRSETDEQGYFGVSGRRLYGQRLKIGEIEKPGYYDATPAEKREFRFGWFSKDPYLISRDRPVFQIRRDEF